MWPLVALSARRRHGVVWAVALPSGGGDAPSKNRPVFRYGLPARLSAIALGQRSPKVHRVAVLDFFEKTAYADGWQGYRAPLAELGHREGINVVIDMRLADSVAERLPALVRELVALRPLRADEVIE